MQLKELNKLTNKKLLPLKPCQNSCYDVYISGKIIINRPNSDIVLC